MLDLYTIVTKSQNDGLSFYEAETLEEVSEFVNESDNVITIYEKYQAMTYSTYETLNEKESGKWFISQISDSGYHNGYEFSLEEINHHVPDMLKYSIDTEVDFCEEYVLLFSPSAKTLDLDSL